MARITVEDCLEKIGDENRFALVHLAVARIKQRRRGAPLLIEERKNKEVVMALREIADAKVTLENIRSLVVKGRDVKEIAAEELFESSDGSAEIDA